MTLVAEPQGFPTAVQARSGRSFAHARAYVHVIHALIMHDIKNRFFGSGLGQIVMVLWPFAHILVLLIIYSVTKRVNPFGESIIQYSAVSIYPFIAFNYTGRWIVYSAMTNRSFLQYPIIGPLDIVVARALLEMVSATLVAILLILLVVVMGYNAMPADPTQAAYAAGATILLALGFGCLNAAIAFIVPLWVIVISLFIILLYISSGILFVVSYMPEQFRVPLSYNPLLQCTEWMRTAYYPDYPTLVLDRTYVLECALVMLTLGLILIRLLRRFF